jgi:hypothetical protein
VRAGEGGGGTELARRARLVVRRLEAESRRSGVANAALTKFRGRPGTSWNASARVSSHGCVFVSRHRSLREMADNSSARTSFASTDESHDDGTAGDVELASLVQGVAPAVVAAQPPVLGCGARARLRLAAAGVLSLTALALALGLGLGLGAHHVAPPQPGPPSGEWLLVEDPTCPSYTRDVGGNRASASCVRSPFPGAMLVRDRE